MKDIIITVGTAIGSPLELARSIRREVECKVYILCTNKKVAEIISASKYVDEVTLLYATSENEYVQKMKEWYNNHTFECKPILYFTFDTACFYINNHRKWFEDNFELCLPSSEIINIYTQKGIAEKEAEKAGLDVPKTKILEKEKDNKHVIDSFNFPVILKPRATYLKDGIDFKIKVINEIDEFSAFTSECIKKGYSLICQEFIPGGDDVSFYYLFYRTKDGQIIDNVGRKTLQTTPRGGIMAKGMVEYNEELAQMSRDFLNKINYIGIGGIEYKKHENKYYFIEMSTRLEGFYKIAEISNSPLSLASYYDNSYNLKAIKNKLSSKQNDGYVYIDLMTTVIVKVKSHKYFSLLNDLCSILLNKKVKLNIFDRLDVKPFLFSLKSMILRRLN